MFPCWLLLILWCEHDSRHRKGCYYAPASRARRPLFADDNCQLPNFLQAEYSLPSWFGLVAHSDGWDRIEKLPVLPHVAIGTQSHEIVEGVVAQLAHLDLVVDLQILERPALLTAPFVPLQHPLHQAPINLLSQLDPLHFLQHFSAVSTSLPLPWLARSS